jgi:phage tail tape-measure protein
MSATRELLEVQVDGSQVIVGVFKDTQEAERARGMLAADGFDLQQVKILAKSVADAADVVPTQSPARDQALTEPEAHRMQGQVSIDETAGSGRINLGTGVGFFAGAIGGVAVGLAVINLPGLDAVFSPNDPTVPMIVGGLIGAVLGAWGGSAAGIPIPEEDTSYFTGDLDNGAYLVAVRTNRIDEAIDVLRDAGAQNLADYEGDH